MLLLLPLPFPLALPRYRVAVEGEDIVAKPDWEGGRLANGV